MFGGWRRVGRVEVVIGACQGYYVALGVFDFRYMRWEWKTGLSLLMMLSTGLDDVCDGTSHTFIRV